MAKRHIAAALIAILAGCSMPPPRVIVQKVDIPVPTARIPSNNLVQCTDNLIPPVFVVSADQVVLPKEQIPVFQSFVALLIGCESAWRNWALSPLKEASHMSDTDTTPITTDTGGATTDNSGGPGPVPEPKTKPAASDTPPSE